jgi:hypothetical protein
MPPGSVLDRVRNHEAAYPPAADSFLITVLHPPESHPITIFEAKIPGANVKALNVTDTIGMDCQRKYQPRAYKIGYLQPSMIVAVGKCWKLDNAPIGISPGAKFLCENGVCHGGIEVLKASISQREF